MDKCTRRSVRATAEGAKVVLPRKWLVYKLQLLVERIDRPTQRLKTNKQNKKTEKKNNFTTKASSFCLNTPRPLNPTGPSLNPPACPVLAVSRIIIYLYLNTHKAYTGEGTTTQEKQGYTQSRERSKAVKEQRKKKKKKQIKVTSYRSSGGYYGEGETLSSEYLLIKTRPDWAMPDQKASEAAEWSVLADKLKMVLTVVRDHRLVMPSNWTNVKLSLEYPVLMWQS